MRRYGRVRHRPRSHLLHDVADFSTLQEPQERDALVATARAPMLAESELVGAPIISCTAEDLAKTKVGDACIGACRTCLDITVIPAWSDGRCFGCTSNEVDEPEWIPSPNPIVFSDVYDDNEERQCGILELFNEQQLRAAPHTFVPVGTDQKFDGFHVERGPAWFTKAAVVERSRFPLGQMDPARRLAFRANVLIRPAHAIGYGARVSAAKVIARIVALSSRHCPTCGRCVLARFEETWSRKRLPFFCSRKCQRHSPSVVAAHRASAQRQRDRRRAAGLCLFCGERPAVGLARCEPCKVERQMKRRGLLLATRRAA